MCYSLPMNRLTTKQVRFLRSKGHPLKCSLQLGKRGANEGFHRELEAALATNELVKIKLGRRVEVDLDAVCTELGAVLIHKVGRTVVLYRPAAEPTLKLPQ